MSITLTESEVGDTIVMKPGGRLTLGEGASEFRSRIEQYIFGRELTITERWYGMQKPSGKPVNLLVDLSEVSYLDSSGLGELFSAHTAITNSGGHIKLLGLTKRVRDLLQITRLYTVFEVFEDQTAALRSFH